MNDPDEGRSDSENRRWLLRQEAIDPDSPPKLYLCTYCHAQIFLLPHEIRICQSPWCIECAIADLDKHIFELQLSIPRAHSELLPLKAELAAKIIELDRSAPNSIELAQYKAQLTSLNANLGFHAKNDRVDQIVALQEQIRELAKRSNRPSFSEDFRRELWERDRKVCYLCKKIIASWSGDSMHVDHVRPRSQGGSDEAHNLRIAHPTCNLQKGDRELSERRLQSVLSKLRKTAEEEAKERLF